MGAYLSQPITEKETEDGGDETGMRWGAAGMQGWRTGMEDSHLACLDLRGDSGTATTGPPVAAFAVFDGHGGAEVAKYCAAHICDVVRATEAFREGDVGLGLKQTFLRMDDLLRTPAGQAELLAFRKASKNDSSDSDDGEEELVDMDMLSKINPETHMQIMEQMKRAMRDQFRSKGKLLGGDEVEEGEEDDDESEHDDDSRYSSEDEDEDADDDDNEGDKEDKKGDGDEPRQPEDGEATAAATAAAGAMGDDVEPCPNASDEPEDKSSGGPRGGVANADVNGTLPEEETAENTSPSTVDPAVVVAEKAAGEGDVAGGARSDSEAGVDAVVRREEPAEGCGEAELNVEVDGAGEPDARPLEPSVRRRCGFDCGATAVMGLVVDGKTLVVANAGDSRCVVSRKGVAVDMSVDHKPEDDVELARIEKAGGSVVDGRVQGNLNLSRAIGDLMYKADGALSPEEQMITADPELKTLELTVEDEFVVLACDGVWNSLSSQETIDFIRERLKGKQGAYPLSSVCADLCDACCAETADGDGTGLDNVTAVIVELNTAGASELTGGRGGVPTSTGASEGEGSGEMDTSDDGKRKQEEAQGGARGRSGKQMRADKPEAEGAVAADPRA